MERPKFLDIRTGAELKKWYWLKAELVSFAKVKGKNIFIEGGAEIVNALLKETLIDEFIISVIPVLIGNGKKLFDDGRPELELELVSTKQFEKGLVQLHYKRAQKEVLAC